MKYVPRMIRIIARNFKATVFLSISSCRTRGRYFVTKIAKNSVNNGVIREAADTNVIGPSEAA